MQDFRLSVSGTRAVVEFDRADLNEEALRTRMHEILPLLDALISADRAWQSSSEEDRRDRLLGWIAADMKAQAALSFAVVQAKVLIAIADGSESIVDHGFPEIRDDHIEDL